MQKSIIRKLYNLRAYPPALGWDRISALKEFSQIISANVDVATLSKNREFYNSKRRGDCGMASRLAKIKQCWACGLVSKKLHAHHIILLKNGGHSDPTNLVMICGGCHGLIHGFMPTKFSDTRNSPRVDRITQDTIRAERMQKECDAIESIEQLNSEYDNMFK